jgi:SNF2 family DNA or RNA helicase
VVYSDHIGPAKLIYDSLISKKVNARHIDGGVSVAKRDQIIDDFQADKVDVLVLTIQSCKEGITLTAARHMVFNDISWSYVDLQQARKRIHRVGQASTCFIHYILSSDTDAWLKRKVLEKKRNLEEIL